MSALFSASLSCNHIIAGVGGNVLLFKKTKEEININKIKQTALAFSTVSFTPMSPLENDNLNAFCLFLASILCLVPY